MYMSHIKTCFSAFMQKYLWTKKIIDSIQNKVYILYILSYIVYNKDVKACLHVEFNYDAHTV